MKNLVRFTVSFSVLLISKVALATPLVCQWQAVKVTDPSFSRSELRQYYRKVEFECEYTLKMGKVSQKLAEMGRPMGRLNYYQGLRYVDRYSFEKARRENIPLNVIFQIKPEDYEVPIAQRSHLVWDNWSKGIATLHPVKEQLRNGQPFTLEFFKQIHRSFYTADESGQYGMVMGPGTIKDAKDAEISWTLKEKQNEVAANVQAINHMYLALGLEPKPTEATGFTQIMLVQNGLLKPSHPAYSETHIKNLLSFLDRMIQNMREHKPLVWNGKIFTPRELALFVQQTIVRIHGFHDGNGRISRYMQDLVLALFDMPAIPSGDLQVDDMTMLSENYYELATRASDHQLQVLDACTDKRNQNFDCQLVD
ncbi:Fic family protein [Pseudobdellovibrio sp. HCB154]|uniref:Fic family protein n=1 Tax=Pseudobdellovibrio sp. HCB154 TaxID=3386277 RepID=UPI0039175807